MKDIPWFKHDFNASADEKLVALRADYGWCGMGWYWYIVEVLRGQEDYALHMDKKLLVGSIATQLNISREKLLKFLNDCIDEYELFIRTDDEKCITSASLLHRMKAYNNLKIARSLAGKKGAQVAHNKDGFASETDGKDDESAGKSRNYSGKASGKRTFASQNPSERKKDRMSEGLIERKNGKMVLPKEEKANLDNNADWLALEKSLGIKK